MILKNRKKFNAMKFNEKDERINAPIVREMFDGTWTKMATIGDFDTSIVEHLENPYYFFLSTPCSSVSRQSSEL